MKFEKNIVLCGFMGCGKSTVGLQLSKITGMPFVDMDAFIEKRAGMTVSSIFEKYGEVYFRDLEYQAVQELSLTGGKIIAAGGGALTFARNTAALRATGKVIFLNPPFEEIKKRLQNDTARPLLRRPDREKAMRALYDARLPLYTAAADVVISASEYPTAVCALILQRLNLSAKQ